MNLFIALLLIMLSYQVESKWDQSYSYREQANRLEPANSELIDREPEQYHRKQSHKQDWPGRREDEQQYYKRANRHQWTHKENKEDWSNKREQINFANSKKYTDDPPDHTELIQMARYVIHNADWASIATISTLPAIGGFPFSNVKSMCDGYIANSTGIPYFYMSPLDFTARDLKRNSRATVLATLEETKFCAEKEYDAEDPRCTRVMLSGKMQKVPKNTTEYTFAEGALFERHPAMAKFPADHDFFVAKLKIAQIAMVDWFGGAKYIPVRDYLTYNYTQASFNKKIVKTHEISEN